MFKKELEDIKTKYANSLELLSKLKEVYTDYEYKGSKYDKILHLDIRINETENTIKKKVFDAINNIISYNNLHSVKGNFGYYNDNRTLEDAYKTIENINLQTMFDSVCYYQPYYTGNRECEKITLDNDKMMLKSCRSYDKDLYLILNCIWLMCGHNTIIDWELRNKIYQKIKDGITFIFCNCKENGKLNITFSNKELFKKFSNYIKIGIQNAQIEYNKNKEA